MGHVVVDAELAGARRARVPATRHALAWAWWASAASMR